ncbi:class I SAM-dependent methyltransferase [Capnocytophaga cynodegmi]|uniref:class I SAM-dependent methyltransferase n=1 Tax=Capnocytophaga cynodegmi TaxID=28189 RepID=UPI00385F8733
MKNEITTTQLGDIPETMLITLWARATESKRADALIRDEKAIEMMERVDYDFSKFEGAKMSQVGVCIRAKLMDEQTKTFLNQYPDAVVIQLGAGLDTRYNRLKTASFTHWYDLDLSEVISIRKQLLTEDERNTFLPLSLFDYRWVDKVLLHHKPILIIIEGVLMYFTPKEVQDFFNELCSHFEGVRTSVLFDMLFYKGVGRAKNHDSVKKTAGKAEFKWSLLNTKDMEQWNKNIHLQNEFYMSDYDNGRFPWISRMFYKIPYFYKNFNQRIVQLDLGR